MEEKGKILYLSHDTRVAVHNAVFAGISRYAAMRGWTAESVNYRLSHCRSLSELLAEKRPVGCIVECSNGPPDLPPAAFGRVPAVFMNCLSAPRGRRIARVAVDNGSVAAAAFRELSTGNPDGFAVVGFSDSSSADAVWSPVRVAAFRTLCRKARKHCLCLVDWGGGGDEPDARLREWIAALPPRTAVFAVNDATAASIARAAKAAGRSIPRDLTLVGVDNDAALCEAASPPLSSIPMDFENGGFLAARTLAERILHPGSAGFQPANTARPEAAPPSAAGKMPALPGVFQPAVGGAASRRATSVGADRRAARPGSAGFQPADTARPEAAPPRAAGFQPANTAGKMPALPGGFQPSVVGAASRRANAHSNHGVDTVLYGPLLVIRRRSTGGRGRREPWVIDAVETIRREACGGLTAAALAKRFRCSRWLLEKRFREAMGHSILDEIQHVRLQRVQTLLEHTQTAIGAIAGLCGFGSEIELRHLFRRRTGMSMREWRKRRGRL